MPTRSVHPCSYPGCNTLVLSQYCAKHKQAVGRQKEEGRLTAHQRGYTVDWHKARTLYLRDHPWCVECKRAGKRLIDSLANEVDHIIPHKGDMVFFWDQANWQSLCHHHHSAKTAKENGGFGRPARQTRKAESVPVETRWVHGMSRQVDSVWIDGERVPDERLDEVG